MTNYTDIREAERERIMDLSSKILFCDCSTSDSDQCEVCEFTDAVYQTGKYDP